MKSVGLITEYNPFHNGHLYHLRESLRVSGANVSVAVMSGHFLQRGEPALVDKWRRAQMALACGVDLVVELPLPWACSSAPDFAAGGVAALNALGVNALCFGSESGDLTSLQRYSELIQQHHQEIEQRSAALLRQEGMNYPTARAHVVAELLGKKQEAEALSAPNNILAIAYLKALETSRSDMTALTIARLGAGYHDSRVREGQFSSATGIRRCLNDGEDFSNAMPEQALLLLQQALDDRCTYDDQYCFRLLLGQIYAQVDELDRYHLVEAGIEQRLLSAADHADSMDALIDGIKSRQLTRTRVQRMLMALLLGLKKESAADLLKTGPRYLHLLGSSDRGRRYLAAGRKRRSLPLIQKFPRIYATLKRYYGDDSREYRSALLQLELEQKAGRIYGLLSPRGGSAPRNRDFYQSSLASDSPR